MNVTSVFEALLVFATLTTFLVTVLLFTFALIVMPGIGSLDDRTFLRAFQSVDAIIQRGHPLFLVVWLGSVVSLVAVAVMGLTLMEGQTRGFLIAAAGIYILGVQLPTIKGNVPLNNRLQTYDLSTLSEAALAELRLSFEEAWNRLNLFRTGVAMIVSLLLILASGGASG